MPKLPTAPLVEAMYPSLAGVEPHQDDGSSFRLTEIRNLERRLEQERDHRANMYKKYRRAINAVDCIDTVLVASSLGMGVAGVGLPLYHYRRAHCSRARDSCSRLWACRYCRQVHLSPAPHKSQKTRRNSRSRPIKAQQHNGCDLKRAPRWAHLSRRVQASTRRDG